MTCECGHEEELHVSLVGGRAGTCYELGCDCRQFTTSEVAWFATDVNAAEAEWWQANKGRFATMIREAVTAKRFVTYEEHSKVVKELAEAKTSILRLSGAQTRLIEAQQLCQALEAKINVAQVAFELMASVGIPVNDYIEAAKEKVNVK